MNKNQKNVRFCFFSWFFKNCELIKDSSLWRSNFILSVCDSVIIIRSGFVTYTFGSRFIYNRWVRVSIEIWILAFLGKYSNIICWISKCVDWDSIIWYQGKGSKIRFIIPLFFHFLLSSYLVPFIFIIPCSCFVTCTKLKSCTKFKKKKWKKRSS